MTRLASRPWKETFPLHLGGLPEPWMRSWSCTDLTRPTKAAAVNNFCFLKFSQKQTVKAARTSRTTLWPPMPGVGVQLVQNICYGYVPMWVIVMPSFVPNGSRPSPFTWTRPLSIFSTYLCTTPGPLSPRWFGSDWSRTSLWPCPHVGNIPAKFWPDQPRHQGSRPSPCTWTGRRTPGPGPAST